MWTRKAEHVSVHVRYAHAGTPVSSMRKVTKFKLTFCPDDDDAARKVKDWNRKRSPALDERSGANWINNESSTPVMYNQDNQDCFLRIKVLMRNGQSKQCCYVKYHSCEHELCNRWLGMRKAIDRVKLLLVCGSTGTQEKNAGQQNQDDSSCTLLFTSLAIKTEF